MTHDLEQIKQRVLDPDCLAVSPEHARALLAHIDELNAAYEHQSIRQDIFRNRIDELTAQNEQLRVVVEAARRRRAKGAPDHPIWAEFDAAVRLLPDISDIEEGSEFDGPNCV